MTHPRAAATERWLLDGRPLVGASAVRGIGTYVRGLLRGLAALGLADRVELLLPRDVAPPEIGDGVRLREGARLPQLRRRLQPVADHVLVARALRASRPTLFHATEWAEPLFGATPVVVTVHDLIPFLVGRAYRWMAWERRLALALLPRADAVITPSQATADDVVRIARVPEERIVVVPHGVDGGFRPATTEEIDATARRLGLPRPWILAVGTFDAHKRLGLLLETARLVTSFSPVDLVIAGDQGGYWPHVRAQVAASGLGDRVHLVGRVPEADLRALYGGARCLVHTSAYEGFGLPLLEAMACGCPVVAVAASAIPEVCGSAAVLVEEANARSLAVAVLTTIQDGEERRRRIADGLAHAAQFTWERTAAETAAVYRRVVEHRAAR